MNILTRAHILIVASATRYMPGTTLVTLNNRVIDTQDFSPFSLVELLSKESRSYSRLCPQSFTCDLQAYVLLLQLAAVPSHCIIISSQHHHHPPSPSHFLTLPLHQARQPRCATNYCHSPHHWHFHADQRGCFSPHRPHRRASGVAQQPVERFTIQQLASKVISAY